MLSLVTKSPLALSKVPPTRLDCCENGPRRQRRRRGVDSSFSNLFATYFSNTQSLFSDFFLHTFQAAVLPRRLQSRVKQWFPHGVTFPRPLWQHAAACRAVALPHLSAMATRAPCFAHFSHNFLPARAVMCAGPLQNRRQMWNLSMPGPLKSSPETACEIRQGCRAEIRP